MGATNQGFKARSPLFVEGRQPIAFGKTVASYYLVDKQLEIRSIASAPRAFCVLEDYPFYTVTLASTNTKLERPRI